ncbi:MAG TPA: hypothetical protein VKR32_10985 [Puia sp.]|nr:hypothetical protein [Puia sp.]
MHQKFNTAALRTQIIDEINQLIYMLEEDAHFEEIIIKRGLIKSLYGQLDLIEREEFISIFGEKFFHEIIETIPEMIRNRNKPTDMGFPMS